MWKPWVYSLSGLLKGQHCGGTLHIHQDKVRRRAYCYRRRQGPKCAQRSAFLDAYETQIPNYLESFSLLDEVPEALRDVQMMSREDGAEVAAQKQRIEPQLTDVRTMFELGDLSKEEYMERREQLIRQ
jgi:hypothetical protein